MVKLHKFKNLNKILNKGLRLSYSMLNGWLKYRSGESLINRIFNSLGSILVCCST